MGLVINNNVPSLTGQHNLNKTTTALAKSLERLSSGLRINRGADGPAALIISEHLRAQIAGLNQAIDNTEKGAAMVQTAEGALNEINSMLIKMRTLALDSANEAVQDTDTFAANQAELDNLLDTINRIANNTQFGTKKLLDGSAGMTGTASDADVTFLKATGDTSPGTYTVEVTTVGERATISAAAQTAVLAQDETLTVNGVTITLNAGMSRTQVVNRINEFTGQTGVVADDDPAAADTTRLRSVQFGSNASITVTTNVTPAGGDDSGFTSGTTASGVNVEGEIDGVAYTGIGNVLTANSGAAKGVSVSFAEDGADAALTVTGAQGNVTVIDNSLQFQIGPNANQTAEIAVDRVNPEALGLGLVGNQFASLSELDIQSVSGANDALEVIDAAIDEISTLRGRLGAFQQNTLEVTANNLRATLENTVAAESVIRDTDFAEETANFTKQQILLQSGTTVLSNANLIPQVVLALLGG
jgi:flagellin